MYLPHMAVFMLEMSCCSIGMFGSYLYWIGLVRHCLAIGAPYVVVIISPFMIRKQLYWRTVMECFPPYKHF